MFSDNLLEKVVKETMLIELNGMSIAATTGIRLPVTAKLVPIIL